jgi:hypothetical protein
MSSIPEEKILELCAVKDFGPPKGPAHAKACLKVVEKCVEGKMDDEGLFSELATLITSNGISFRNLKESDKTSIKAFLKRIDLDVKHDDPINNWIRILYNRMDNDKEKQAVNCIANNNILLDMLRSFVIITRHPDIVVGTPSYEDAMNRLSRLRNLKPRVNNRSRYDAATLTERVVRKPVGNINLQTGGGVEMNIEDARLFDALENSFTMIGGAETVPKMHKHLVEVYEEAKKDLLSKHKKIDDSDNVEINRLLNEFKTKEDELHIIFDKFSKVKDNLNNNATIDYKSLAEAYKLSTKDYTTKGLTIVGILKCIRDGCNVETAKLWADVDITKSNARIQDIQELFERRVKETGSPVAPRSPTPRSPTPRSPRVTSNKYESVTSSVFPNDVYDSPTSPDNLPNNNNENDFFGQIKKFFSF